MNARAVWIQSLVDGCIQFMTTICDIKPYTYQKEIADRIFFSLLFGDSDEITIETARQAGKSEVLADIIVTALVLFPKLAAMFPDDEVISKFKNGVMIGVFGPIDLQADNIFSRIEMRLTSVHAKSILSNPEIDDECHPSGVVLRMKSGSFCRKQTAHPKAKIESSTYHLAVIDEAQDADSSVVQKSIHPMTVAVGGSIVKVGTPSAHKSDFYEALKRNKARRPHNGKKNYFGYDWKRVVKENPHYARSIKKEMERYGEDSDEFQMSYCLKWLLDRGMFITDERIQQLGDKSMEIVHQWFNTPVVVGIDVAREHDSTVVTVVYVDWNHADEFGLYDHRILNWLELHGEDWESQYAQIANFLSNYWVMTVAVDGQGMGGPVAERLQDILPNMTVIAMDSNPIDQHARWTHLIQLIQRGLVRWPNHIHARRTERHLKFVHQMGTVEKEYKGKYIKVEAPNEKNAHDDYPDSLALACALTITTAEDDQVEQWSSNPFLERGMGASR